MNATDGTPVSGFWRFSRALPLPHASEISWVQKGFSLYQLLLPLNTTTFEVNPANEFATMSFLNLNPPVDHIDIIRAELAAAILKQKDGRLQTRRTADHNSPKH
jgi:hypothetical protein